MTAPLLIALAIFLISLPTTAAAQNADPLEGINRTTHQFNRTLDRFLIKPLAQTYDRIAPRPVKQGLSNFFGNLDDVRVTFNDLVQLNFAQASADLSRLVVNSTLGVGGLMDVADPVFGLEKNTEDFGISLSQWGMPAGPYLVLPLLGPTTLRDAFGRSVDTLVDPLPAVDHVSTRNSLQAGSAIDFRADVLYFDDLIIGDDYLFVREAYLQYREQQTSPEGALVAFDAF